MSCTKDVMGVHLTHHAWRPRVTWSDRVTDRDTDMWGRPVINEHVVCHKDEVCEVCGAVRDGVDCLCDPALADRCAIRLAWMDRTRETVA